jgi:NAD(P)-dependent dehydrogenase (short-subunit alcohol dehydrogenase family)
MSSRADAGFRVLVIGCASGSFGHYVAEALRGTFDADRSMYPQWTVLKAGHPDEPTSEYEYDVTDQQLRHNEAMLSIRPHHVVYAVGVNRSDWPGDGPTLANSAVDHFEVNVAGFLRVAEAFKSVALPGSQLVAVSSNSAYIPRSPSVGYCISKAALSMAVRTLARRWKGEPIVWGVEPGLMNTRATINTVNSGALTDELGRRVPAHRMQGVSSQFGLSAHQLAESVAHDVLWGGHWLNGTLRQMDAGEL